MTEAGMNKGNPVTVERGTSINRYLGIKLLSVIVDMAAFAEQSQQEQTLVSSE